MKKIMGTKIGNVVNLLIDGNAFQKTFASQEEANEFFKLLIRAKAGDEPAQAEIMKELNRRYKTVIKDVLEKDSADIYYLKGIDVPLPKVMAETFLDYLENNFPVTALSNFWKLLVTNPDPRVREDLFQFLKQYHFAITDNGYFTAYKAVEMKDKHNVDLAAFVSNEYLKFKKWKKNPANFEVVTFKQIDVKQVENPDYDPDYEPDLDDDEDYVEEKMNEPEFIEETVIKYVQKSVLTGERNPNNGEVYQVHGNLLELFKNIDKLVERSVYQSKYTGKNGKVEQVLGVPVQQERSTTNNDPKVECSDGLHVGSTKYVEWYGSAPNDIILLVLVNPAHVVAVPEYDKSKMRTCEYFPYAVLDRLEGGKFEVIEEIPYFEEDYMKYEKSELEKQVATIQAEIASALSTVTQEKLDYKKILEDRIVTLEGVLSSFFPA